MEIKQLRLKFFKGINSDGEILYSDSYNLNSKIDTNILKHIAKENKFLKGFIIEGSNFEEGTYNQDFKENEFLPIFEILHGENLGNEFKIGDDNFNKMPYHVIEDSILDVRNYLYEVLICSNGGINDVIEYTEEILINNKQFKKIKK